MLTAQKEFHDIDDSVMGYIGREKTDSDVVALPLVRRLAALLNRDPNDFLNGSELPVGWTAVLFGDTTMQSALGQDGHPTKGDFLPPVSLPRRMFAGREVSYLSPLRVGDAVSRRTVIESVTPKIGATGKLVFVKVRNEIRGPVGCSIVEMQTIVYREEASAVSARQVQHEADVKPDWEMQIVPDPVMLFRYSAVAFNGHRIHFDIDYAREQEGYEGLVVNGGLTTLLLLETAKTRFAQPIVRYRMQARKPAFAGRRLHLMGRNTKEGAKLWATNNENQTVMEIDVELSL